MKLYFAPGACSLADHIALHEAGLRFEHEKVDLKTKTTASGADFTAINEKGYVPALELDGGELVTENVAILDWIAHQVPALRPDGELGHTRLLEKLAYISTELHKSFAPFFGNGDEEAKRKAADKIGKRLTYLAERLDGDFLFGDRFTVADCYLFVMLTWARKNGIDLPEPLPAYFERVSARDSVQTAQRHEAA